MARKILCFGDSNTYGYDPRSPLGGRYPAEIRWTNRLADLSGWTVRNAGANGRRIPHTPAEIEQVNALIARTAPLDLVCVMLGGNDLLQDSHFVAEDVAARMEAFLRALQLPAQAKLLLLGPSPMVPGSWVADERLLTQAARLSECYRPVAERLGIAFADVASWGVTRGFDGVHFTEDGHRAFAAGMAETLSALFPGKR